MHFEVCIIVNVPRSKAFATYTDFEAMPKWSRQGNAVKVLKREGDSVLLETSLLRSGRKGLRKVRLSPPERAESDGETRFTRTESVVSFEETTGGTKVTASLDVRFKGRWGWVLRTPGRVEAEASAMEELKAFARHVESLPD